MRFSVFLLNTTLLLSAMPLSAQVQHSLSFNLAEFSFSNDTIGVTPYSKVGYQGLYGGGNVAAPELPIKYVTFAVPTLCHDITVTAITSGETITTLSLPLYPVQEPKSVNDTTETYTLPDETIYNTDEFYPQNIASVVDEGYFDGNKHMVTVAVYPSQYNPVTGNLKSFSTINLTVNYSSGLSDNPALVPISRNLDAPEIISTIKSIVANPSQVEQFATHTGSIMPLSTYSAEDSLPGYEYCIITSRELAPAFKRLVHFKRQKGIDAGIVCMEDILESSLYQDGDLKSSINDDAGKLRQYLKDAWQYHNTKYVLLGGKPPHVPIRYGHVYNNSNYNDDKIPTDLYFSDFNGDWDVDGDYYYGEWQDKVDFNPELYVGRLLCKNQEEINNYINKLLIYELNPGNGDYSYLTKSFTYYSFDIKDYMLENDSAIYYKIENTTDSMFYNNKLFQNKTYPKGADVINILNQNPVGIFFPNGHGNPGSITIIDNNYTNSGAGSSVRYGITPIDNPIDPCGMTDEVNNGWDCLNNKYYPNIIYTISCTNIPYDIYTNDNNRTYDIPMNLGESFTLGKDYGGVAYLGNTRNGYLPYSFELQQLFLDLINMGMYNIGILEAISKYKYLNYRYVRFSHNLLGDPEFMIWTNIISKYNQIYIYRSDYNEIVIESSTLDNNDITGATVAVYNTDGSVTKHTSEYFTTRFFDISPNSSVMIYSPNMIPYIAPVVMQNETINSSVSFFTTTASLGNAVDENRTFGDLIFDNGADFTIYASGDVLIDSGVIVKSGATLTIESNGKVTIAGGRVESGGVLNIKAIECDMSHDFNTKKGATVNIHKIN